MADEGEENAGGGGGDAPDEGGAAAKAVDCPKGLPAWMATFSDLVTLLLTFFVLLLSFAKTEVAKYEAALGSIRNAFGGNVLKHGEVIQRGKSPDDSPSMLDSQEPIKPFPIEFLTMEGILDKHEINRESDEDLKIMKSDLREFSLSDSTEIYEMPEGIKVKIKDKIYFKDGSTDLEKITIEVFDRMVKLLSNKKWTVFVLGHARVGEVSQNGKADAYELSSKRALGVARSLIRLGVSAERVTVAFFGDSRPDGIKGKSQKENDRRNRRVEFILRKTDLDTEGHKVGTY